LLEHKAGEDGKHFATGKHLLPVLVIVLIGFLLRLSLTFVLPMGWDGGTFMYWANLVNQGATPYRDFFLRDPVYIYLVALSMKILGVSYLAISLVSILPSTASIAIVYMISRDLFDHRTAILSSLLYGLSPTIIWYNTVFDPHTLMLFLSSSSMLFLIKGLKTNDSKYFAAFGALLGGAVFAYRGVAVYAVTSPLLLGYILASNKAGQLFGPRKWLRQVLAVAVPFFLIGTAILLLFSTFSNVSWMLSSFGFGGQQESASYFIFGEVLGPAERARVLFVAVREWLYLMAPATIFLVLPLVHALSRRVVFILTGISGVSVLLALALGSMSRFRSAYGAYEPALIYNIVFWVSLITLISSALLLLPIVSSKFAGARKPELARPLLLYWFLSTALLVGLFGVPLVNYYYFFAPVFTIMAAPIIMTTMSLAKTASHIREIHFPQANAVVFLCLLGVSAVAVSAMIPSTPMTWRDRSMATNLSIASYIQQRTTLQDQILVQDPAIALYAQRGVALGISLTLVYNKNGTEPFNPMPYDPFDLFPNVTEIANYMSAGNVKYVVGDYLVCAMHIHPVWKLAFETNFSQETVIDGTVVYGLSLKAGTARTSCSG